MIDTIILNFESFADIYIRCLVIVYILSMSVLFALWIKPFVHKVRAAYFTTIVYFVFRFIYYLIPVDSDLLQGISIVVVFITFFVVWISDEKRNPVQKLFLCILFYVMSFLTYEISVEIGLFERDLVSRFDWYYSDAKAIAIEFIVWNLVDYALASLIMFISLRIIQKIYKRKSEDLSWRELLILLTPSWAILIVKPIMLAYFRLWMDGMVNGSIKENIPASFYRLGFCILSVFSLIVIILLYQNIRESKENEFARQALESRTEDTMRHVEQIEEMYENIKALRHDMGNHMAVIEGLIQNGEREALDEYIGQWKKNYEESGMSVKTGNPIIDVAISEYTGQFKKANIPFEHSFQYPEQLNINPFDLSVVITNALQNAYEASVNIQDPSVKLTSVTRENTFIISLKNHIDNKIYIDPEEDIPVSSKKDDGHGYGLKNIRTIARKYNGDIEIRQEPENDGYVYILNIMFIG